jgi:hypothetical protein
MKGGDCKGRNLKGEPNGDVMPRKRLRGEDVDTAAAWCYKNRRRALVWEEKR